jgi:hypothetical protein
MAIFIIANLLGSSIQITTLPLPILSPLQASGLVFNSICATVILAEPFTRYSLVGTVLVCIGAGLIAAFGAIKEPAHTLDELLDLMVQKAFVIWMICQAVLVASIIAGTRALTTLRSGSSARLRVLRGVLYGFLSGILSAHSLLVAKTAVELLVRTIVDRKNQFDRWQSWVILLSLLGLALTQLYYMHSGLKLCSTSVLYPLVFCIYNVIAILDGLIYFRQVSQLTLSHALLIALGTVILLVGVLALSWRLTPEGEHTVPVSQSALAPGMGLVADEDDCSTCSTCGEEYSCCSSCSEHDSQSEEEATTEDEAEVTEQTPLNMKKKRQVVPNGALWNPKKRATQKKAVDSPTQKPIHERRRASLSGVDTSKPLLLTKRTGSSNFGPQRTSSLASNSSLRLKMNGSSSAGGRRSLDRGEEDEIWNELLDSPTATAQSRRSATFSFSSPSSPLIPRRNDRSYATFNDAASSSSIVPRSTHSTSHSVAQPLLTQEPTAVSTVDASNSAQPEPVEPPAPTPLQKAGKKLSFLLPTSIIPSSFKFAHKHRHHHHYGAPHSRSTSMSEAQNASLSALALEAPKRAQTVPTALPSETVEDDVKRHRHHKGHHRHRRRHNKDIAEEEAETSGTGLGVQVGAAAAAAKEDPEPRQPGLLDV